VLAGTGQPWGAGSYLLRRRRACPPGAEAKTTTAVVPLGQVHRVRHLGRRAVPAGLHRPLGQPVPGPSPVAQRAQVVHPHDHAERVIDTAVPPELARLLGPGHSAHHGPGLSRPVPSVVPGDRAEVISVRARISIRWATDWPHRSGYHRAIVTSTAAGLIVAGPAAVTAGPRRSRAAAARCASGPAAGRSSSARVASGPRGRPWPGSRAPAQRGVAVLSLCDHVHGFLLCVGALIGAGPLGLCR
jgi:hypothetical protein